MGKQVTIRLTGDQATEVVNALEEQILHLGTGLAAKEYRQFIRRIEKKIYQAIAKQLNG